MKVLVADDDAGTRILLASLLGEAGYEVVEAEDGKAALAVLTGPEPPPVAILDWVMPELNGVEVCRQLRQLPNGPSTYLILLTLKQQRDDTIAGLDAGADDFIGKPFDPGILRARVRAGERLIQLQMTLAERVADLEEALAQVKTLSGLLPICTRCKAIRDDQGYWNRVEAYVSARTSAQFTHGLCPGCAKTLHDETDWDALRAMGEARRRRQAQPPPAAGPTPGAPGTAG